MSIPSFKDYLKEENREVFFTYGAMNPPTVEHGRTMTALATKAGRNPYKVFLTQNQDSLDNPLTYEQKIKHTRKMFPKFGRNIVRETSINSVLDIASNLYEQGYNRITMVVGSDRVTEFTSQLNMYNGKESSHGFYVFESLNVVSSGRRDPDITNLIEGFARHNDFTQFSQGVPNSMSNRDAKKLFNDVRVGQGLKETTEFKNHVTLESVSEIRERFIEGELFNEGDRVRTKTGALGNIHRLGSNYVIVSLDEGRIARHWLDDVEKLDVDEGFGANAGIQDFMPGISAFFDRIRNSKRYEFATKVFLKYAKESPKTNRQNMVRASKTADVDTRRLDKYLHDLAKQGKIPKSMVDYVPTYKEDYSPQKHEWGTDASVKHAKKLTPNENIDEDEVRKTRDDINKEKDLDKVKFDRMLDKARIRRAVRKNKDTDGRTNLTTTDEAKASGSNPVAKHAKSFNKSHVFTDRKKAKKGGYEKHKKNHT